MCMAWSFDLAECRYRGLQRQNAARTVRRGDQTEPIEQTMIATDQLQGRTSDRRLFSAAKH